MWDTIKQMIKPGLKTSAQVGGATLIGGPLAGLGAFKQVAQKNQQAHNAKQSAAQSKQAGRDTRDMQTMLRSIDPFYGVKPKDTPNSTPYVHPGDPRNITSNTNSVGSGGYNPPQQAIKPVVEAKPWYYSGDEIANRFGINNDKDAMRAELEELATRQIAESETQFGRLQNRLTKDSSSNYQRYLDDMRRTKQTAASSGAARGTRAAEAIASMMLQGQGQSELAQAGYEGHQDLAQRKETAMADAQNQATQAHNQIGQFLTTMGSQYEANDVNRMSAELMAQAQIEAERIKAGATTSAARIGADAAQNPYGSLEDLVRRAMGGDPAARQTFNTVRTTSGYGVNNASAIQMMQDFLNNRQ